MGRDWRCYSVERGQEAGIGAGGVFMCGSGVFAANRFSALFGRVGGIDDDTHWSCYP